MSIIDTRLAFVKYLTASFSCREVEICVLHIQLNMENGNVVWLKSGGPAMTIAYLNRDTVHCIWFLNGEVKEQDFYLPTLTTEDPN